MQRAFMLDAFTLNAFTLIAFALSGVAPPAVMQWRAACKCRGTEQCSTLTNIYHQKQLCGKNWFRGPRGESPGRVLSGDPGGGYAISMPKNGKRKGWGPFVSEQAKEKWHRTRGAQNQIYRGQQKKSAPNFSDTGAPAEADYAWNG